MSNEADGGQLAKLVILWAVVGIPLAWGVLGTLSNALKLFQ